MTDSTLKFIEDESDKEEEFKPLSPVQLKRQTTYIFTEKRKANLAKARETKAKNKEELLRLREEAKKQQEEPVIVQEEKPTRKPKKKKKIIYQSESSSEEEVIVVKKKKTKKSTVTPNNSPKKVSNPIPIPQPTRVRHDEYIRNLLNL